MSFILSPSILNSDFGHLKEQIEMINISDADWIHLDIMDGVFVPNLTFGMSITSQIKKWAKKPLDVHLMIVQPERYIDAFQQAGADFLTVHYEASVHLHRTIEHILSKGMKAGVAINPHTPVESLSEILPYLDLVLNMTVNPGYGGQKFIERSYEKIKKLKELLQTVNSNAIIEIDGGVDESNIVQLSETGVDAFVVGSYIFGSIDPLNTIKQLKQLK